MTMHIKHLSLPLAVLGVVSLIAGVIAGPLIRQVATPQSAQAVGDPGTLQFGVRFTF